MAQFRFTRRTAGEPASGFELGDLTVVGNRGEATSAGHRPDQGMMIFVSITQLLDGLRVLLDRGKGAYEFVGVDSSFTLDFTLRRDQLTIKRRRTDLDIAPMAETIAALWTAASEFAADPANALPEGDAVRNDLTAALAAFQPYVR
jgi:hypothetical protein